MSSAANSLSAGWGTHGRDQNSEVGLDAMNLEIPVSVTGAKASSTTGSRDLFTEESRTVQVFKDGAVITLVAPIAEGQLLFLTNQKTSQEVVCQVVGKWDFQAPKCYVKLQFTEGRGDYWGVEFPADQPKAESKAEKKNAETSFPVASLPIDSGRVETPSGMDSEVEALRKQLLGEDTKQGKERSIETAPHADHQAAPAESLLMPAAKDRNEAGRAVINMALPISKTKSETSGEASKDPFEGVLAEVESDIAAVPDKAPQVESRKATRPVQAPSLSKGRLIGLSAVLVLALIGGAWYENLWPHLPVGKKTGTVVARPLPPKNAPKSLPSASVAKTEQAANANAAQTSGESANTTANDTKEDASKGKPAETDASRTESRPAESTKEKTSSREEKVREETVKENAGPNVTPSASAAEAVANDAPVTPPKLVKAANPVYPPNAMRSYITGDVKAEVVVDGKGRVTDVTVLSGPQALRAAAVDALKQYQYAPAMQGSKAVEAKTTAVVKFWFNP